PAGADRRTLAGGRGLFLADRATRVAPAVEHVGRDVGDLVVGELRHRRHHRVVLDAVDRDRAGQAVQDHLRQALGIGRDPVGAGERREHALEALAVGLVAGRAGAREQRLAGLDLVLDREFAGLRRLRRLAYRDPAGW